MLITTKILKDQGRTWNYGRPETVGIDIENEWPVELKEKAGEYEFSQPFVTELHNVELLGPVGVGMRGKDVILDTAYAGRLDVLERNMPYMRWAADCRDMVQVEIVELATPMLGVWASNYFHWVLEFLTKLEGIEEYEKQTGKRPLLILESNPPRFVTESLDLLGWEYKTTSQRMFCEALVVPTHRRSDGRISPGAIKYLRKLFQVYSVPITDIYISRKNAREARIEHEKPGDRQVLYNELMSFKEQVDTYSQARTIMAPHGAGLTNMVWSDAGIIELFGEYVNPCYMTLAAACGLDYEAA